MLKWNSIYLHTYLALVNHVIIREKGQGKLGEDDFCIIQTYRAFFEVSRTSNIELLLLNSGTIAFIKATISYEEECS